MDDRGPLVLLFIIICGGLVIAIAHMHQQLVSLQERVTEEQHFSAQLTEQCNEIVTANDKLRERVIDLSGNLSVAESRISACENAVPLPVPVPTQQRIPLDNVLFEENAVVIQADDVVPGIIAPTGSMEPLLTGGNIVLETTPDSPSEILPGDVIVFERDGTRIIHRVLQVGVDSEGWFAVTKGDNADEEDSPIRFSQVRGILVGIIY